MLLPVPAAAGIATRAAAAARSPLNPPPPAPTLHLQFVLLVHDVVQEKEGRVRQAMATMGLRALPFWASWVLFQGLLAALEACLLVGFGYAFGFRLVSQLLALCVCAWGPFAGIFKHDSACQPACRTPPLNTLPAPPCLPAFCLPACLPLQFTGNAFGLSFLLLLMVSLAMTAFGFFVAAFLLKVRGRGILFFGKTALPGTGHDSHCPLQGERLRG